MPVPPVYETAIAIGANLGDSAATVRAAMTDLSRIGTARAWSGLYRNPSEADDGQPDYVNAVARLATTLPAEPLLAELLAIERMHGRVRLCPGAARTLDLDLIWHSAGACALPGLQIPHPRAHRRPFVLVPLAEVWPDLELPGGTAAALAAALSARCRARLLRLA